MSPSDIGIVALNIVPSLVILDAPHSSLKGWQSKDAKSFWLGLSFVGVLFCATMLWHRNKSIRVIYVLIFFVMDVVFVLLLECH